MNDVKSLTQLAANAMVRDKIKLFEDKARESGTLLGSIGDQHISTVIWSFGLAQKSSRSLSFFHNLRGYDSHFIMQEIGSIGKEHYLELNYIPNNMEKYMAFMLGKHFFQFIASSLERLAVNFPADTFKYMSKVFQDENLSLMKKKGVYPYRLIRLYG